jgi:hypothetical protein
VFVLDYSGNVRGKIVQRLAGHGTSAAADAARLGTQDAKAFLGEQRSDNAVIFSAAPKRRQDYKDWTRTLGDHLDMSVAAVHRGVNFGGAVGADVSSGLRSGLRIGCLRVESRAGS